MKTMDEQFEELREWCRKNKRPVPLGQVFITQEDAEKAVSAWSKYVKSQPSDITIPQAEIIHKLMTAVDKAVSKGKKASKETE